MIGGVCLSVRLSLCLVACLDLTRERKGLGSPKLTGWKPIIRVTRKRSVVKVTMPLNAVIISDVVDSFYFCLSGFCLLN